MTNFQKIEELVSKSNLLSPEREELIKLFANTEDSELESVVTIFSDDNSWIEKIYNNYKIKKATMAVESSDLWKEILEQEEKQLEEVKE
jgi:hypothetical protein